MRRIRLFFVALAMAAVPAAGALTAAPAHATCDPDYPCDPPPNQIPQPVSVQFGCGTVTVYVLKYQTKPLAILPCPGPVLVQP